MESEADQGPRRKKAVDSRSLYPIPLRIRIVNRTHRPRSLGFPLYLPEHTLKVPKHRLCVPSQVTGPLLTEHVTVGLLRLHHFEFFIFVCLLFG